MSSDVIGESASCVFDAALTQAAGRFVKVFGWYDNEWGYTCRLADLTRLVAAVRAEELRWRRCGGSMTSV